LAEILPSLVLQDVTLPWTACRTKSTSARIESDELNNPAVGIVRSFNKLMMVQLSSFPLGSSAGGFTYTFDDSLGTFRRTSNSFGPSFAERATTIGPGEAQCGGDVPALSNKSVAFQGPTAVQTAEFDEFDPRPGNLSLMLGTAGFKFNPAGNWIVSASLLFPLTDAGLRSRVTTVVGLDYAF
jgi:hypothetical protein